MIPSSTRIEEAKFQIRAGMALVPSACDDPGKEVVMPYKSEKQRRYLHAKEPALAKKWDKKYGGKVAPKKTTRKGKKK